MAKLFEVCTPNNQHYTFNAERIIGVRELLDGAASEVFAGGEADYVGVPYQTFCTAWKEALKEPEPFVGVDVRDHTSYEDEIANLRAQVQYYRDFK